MKRGLIITYYWPPGGGAGVQRWLKFARYLPETGWEPVVLTVDPAYAQYPATDETLLDDIAPRIQIHRTPATNFFRLAGAGRKNIPSAGFANREKKGVFDFILRFIRGNFFIPDPRKGWNRYAFSKAAELISRQEINVIITSSPPHSTQLIGLKLKKRFPNLKWIADLRDPWTDIYYYNEFLHTPPARYLDALYEKKVLSAADRIITVGETLKEIFAAKVRGSEKKISVVTNGYDDDDFKGLVASTPQNFTITYTGTVSPLYPLDSFTEAVKQILNTGREIKLRFAGFVSGELREKITGSLPPSTVEFLPYVSHPEAIRLMLSSSALLLIIPDHRNNGCIITGKIFEYIAAGKPVILVGPPGGDASDIILSTGAGMAFGYDNTLGIREYILLLINGEFPVSETSKEKYSRKSLTRKLADILSEADRDN
ncbi:MAG: glycosyltransferase family 4 protein [Bacteroidales bacterium]|nr:glycosyltransferase family 4 protein [Bacteroidales bacterium]